jgi:hypothetical protein
VTVWVGEVDAPLVSSTKALTCASPTWNRKPTAWACTEQDLTAVAAVDEVGLPSKVSLSMR